MENIMKNNLLVYPRVPENTYWSFSYALNLIDKKSSMPPLGLLTVAALFPEDCNLKLVDLNIESLSDDDIQWADAVFISAMIVQKNSMAEVVQRCNHLHTKVIAGGPYPTSSWEEIEGVDHFVLGEVENDFIDILIDLTGEAPCKVYRCADRPDLSRTPVPRFDLLKMDAYASMAVQYSRGCPFTCEFCDIWKVYGNRPRLKTTVNMLAELDELYRLGWRGALFIVDDNFIGNKRRVKRELLPALIDWQTRHDHAFRFFTEASINMASDPDLLAGMRAAGFNEVFIGIETPSTESLRETGKFQNIKTDLLKAVHTIQQNGIEVMAGFILGFDSDTEDIFDRQIEFIRQAAIPKAMVGLLSALPGTDLHHRLETEGRMLKQAKGNNTHCLETNFQTRMDAVALKNGYQKVLAAIYDKNLRQYFARCNRLMDRLGPSPYFQRKVGIQEIKYLLKSILYQPFTPYGLQYVKFFMRNAIKNRPIFAEVITYCIMGHHFHTITQETLKTEALASDLEEVQQYVAERIRQFMAARENQSAEVLQSLAQLWKKNRKMLDRIRKKMDRLHDDFREEIAVQYQEVVQKIQQLFDAVETLPSA